MPTRWKNQSARKQNSRGNRALDGHIDHVDHQPASVESLECIMERRRSPDVVEGEDLLHPPRPGESSFPLRQDRAGCDDQARSSVVPSPRCTMSDWMSTAQLDQAELDSLVELVRRERTISVLCVNRRQKSNPGW